MGRSAAQAGWGSGTGVMSPVRVFVFVLATVFLVETLIMLLLEALPGEWAGSVIAGFLDSALLVSALCPVLWVFVVSPLRALVQERGMLIRRVLSAQEDERARLSRDLHDALGQTQTAVLLGLGAVQRATSLDEAHQRAQAVHSMAVEAVESTRRLARGLSPAVLHDFGLGRAIERLAEDVAAATGIQVRADHEIGAARFSPEAEIVAYRVIQEALTNAVKHAHASHIILGVRAKDGWLMLTVSDDGRGFGRGDEAGTRGSNGMGLLGMRERLASLGGRLRIADREAGTGTEIRGEVPAVEVSA